MTVKGVKKMEQHPNMRRARNILLKGFLIIYLLLLVMSAFYYFLGMDWVYRLCEKMFYTAPRECGMVVMGFFAYMKMVAILFFLVPGLAIHFEYFTCKCKPRDLT